MPSADVRQATPLRVPRFGLLASASVSDNLPGVRWGFGVEWLPELHPTGSEGIGARALKCDPTAVEHGEDDKAKIEEAYPFTVYAFDWCSTLGYSGRDWAGRARRLLEATQSFTIAKEFWTGTIAQAESLSNVWLGAATSTLVENSAYEPGKAVARMDRAIAEQLRNGVGMLHTSVEVLGRLVQAQAVWRDGDVWRSPMGNPIVADGGYGAAARDADTGAFIVATTPVEIVLGPVRTIDLTDEMYAAVDHTVNDLVVWAERDVLVMHEPQLIHHAIEVDLS